MCCCLELLVGNHFQKSLGFMETWSILKEMNATVLFIYLLFLSFATWGQDIWRWDSSASRVLYLSEESQTVAYKSLMLAGLVLTSFIGAYYWGQVWHTEQFRQPSMKSRGQNYTLDQTILNHWDIRYLSKTVWTRVVVSLLNSGRLGILSPFLFHLYIDERSRHLNSCDAEVGLVSKSLCAQVIWSLSIRWWPSTEGLFSAGFRIWHQMQCKQE